jgi:hypothetical protein
VSASERRKGADGELEVVKLARQHGWPASRNLDQARDGGADVVGIAGVSLEVKRCERTDVWAWWGQANASCGTRLPVVAFRRSASPWLAIVELDEFFALLRFRERA